MIIGSLYSSIIQTPLGEMWALADEERLFLLEFMRSPALQKKTTLCKAVVSMQNIPRKTAPLISIEQELQAYFLGQLPQFNTPIGWLSGSSFQQQVWQALRTIPCGKTISYAQLAQKVERPLAHRAVANANGANWLAIIVPCHRVIRSGGQLGGYASGIERKRWLLEHEESYSQFQ